jgi:hypothetical protein
MQQPVKYKGPPAVKVRGYNHSNAKVGNVVSSENHADYYRDGIAARQSDSLDKRGNDFITAQGLYGSPAHKHQHGSQRQLGLDKIAESIRSSAALDPTSAPFGSSAYSLLTDILIFIYILILPVVRSILAIDPAGRPVVLTIPLAAPLGPEMVALSMAMKRTNDAAAVAAASSVASVHSYGDVPTKNRSAGAGYAAVAKKHESSDRSHQREGIRRSVGETSNNGSRGRGNGGRGDDEGDEVYEMDFDDDAVDLQKLRAKLDRAKDDKQLKKLESQLVRASEQVSFYHVSVVITVVLADW